MAKSYNTIDELYDQYHGWLCDLIGVTKDGNTYWLLVNSLWLKPFYWSVPNDDNRAFEGKNLREKFCEERNIEYNVDLFHEYATMLELIIGLAYRCESIMADQIDNLEMSEWFWKMLGNVGLDRFSDDAYQELKGHLCVDEILNRIIDRTYQRNGVGGLFPLKRDQRDQRKVELWYQMNAYLMENYYTDEEVL